MNQKIVKSPEECQNIEEIRSEIDSIDKQIVELIAQRARYVKEAAKFKKSEIAVRDEERVKKVVDSKKQLAIENNVSPELIGNIYKTMIDFFINEEIEEWKKNK